MPVPRGAMAWPVLLGCVWLWAGLALAEVGSFENCKGYFYKQASPSGFAMADTADICQQYQNRYHFATLYSKANRIPLWSAYTLDRSWCSQQPKRRNKWFVEPQLSDQNKSPNMTTEAASRLSEDELRSSQAVNEDYEDTSYDRGHLNPNAFQCDERRTATFTLTNAAPMDPCFNRILWYQLEKTLKDQLPLSCMSGILYLVTGTVPNVNVRIPMQSEDEEGDRSRPFNQVSVPSHVWTAVCCDDTGSQKFSLAFLAENREESKLRIMSVEELNAELTRLYVQSVKVFEDRCGSKNKKVKEVVSAVRAALYRTFQILLSNRYSQLLPGQKRNRLDAETSRVMGSQNLDQNSLELTNVRFAAGFPDLSEWQKSFTNLYVQDNLACVLTPAAAAGVAKDSGTSDRECTLQEQKHLPGARITAQGWSCVGAPCGKHDQTAYSWCYTSHGNDWDYCCTSQCSVNPDSEQYECSRGDGSTTSCSPQYSAVTITGKRCRADHPCGLYGEGYYWCYTDHIQTWEYCCSPQDYCGYHTYSYQWCYTEDAEGSWEYCTP